MASTVLNSLFIRPSCENMLIVLNLKNAISVSP